jgi:proteasome accessory factor C
MPRDDEKLLRQLSLVSFLLDRDRPATAAEVRRSVEGYSLMTGQAFARRFYGDREDLHQAGISIEAVDDAGLEGEGQAYYLPQENYYLPDLDLTEAETRSLMIALALLEGRFAYSRPLRLALASLTQGRPNPLQEELERVAVSLAPDTEARELGKLLARLEEAAARRKSVVFGYHSPSSDETKERRLDPYGLFRIGGHWYVVGHDHDRQEERTFRVGRMTGPVRYATKNPRDFEVPDSYDPREHRAKPPWLIGEPSEEAVLRVREDLAWWVARSYPQLEILDSHGEWVRFRSPVADKEALLSWVLALGTQARLEGPASLRQELLGRLRQIGQAHQPPGVESAGWA